MMKIIEHRRHSERDKGGIHLNQRGVDLARKIGESMGKYQLVITSQIDRAIQTAVAMGYSVNETREELNTFGDAVHKIFTSYPTTYPTTMNTLKVMYNQFNEIKEFGLNQVGLYSEFLKRIKEDQELLIVSHGGVIDIPIITLFPDLTFQEDIKESGLCEGYRIKFEDHQPVSFEFLKF